MLIRQKTLLALISQANTPLHPTMLAIFAFLFRHETEPGRDLSFYDFVPYKNGPFSFSLHQELNNLRRDGYVIPDEERITLCEQTANLATEKIDKLPNEIKDAVDTIVKHYIGQSQTELIKDVISRYPWYATKSELIDLLPKRKADVKKAGLAVYTAGYEGKSVDAFFNHLLKHGIKQIIDVRANPNSRQFGFSKKRFCEIANHLGLDYNHFPSLGVPSKHRKSLADFDSYQRLLEKYKKEMLPQLGTEVENVGQLMQKTPSVLVCVEKDIRCCHRSRLADAVSQETGLEVKHL
ncbi:MAG TPA: DUF488 family protein [Acidobacteriota bacterium]|nr:DUF488 family protein [Acidobacteriota bacterium]